MIKNIATLIVLYALVTGPLSHYYYGADYSLSIVIGCLLMLINLAGLAFSWRRIFYKKSIALAVLVIIFKYVILGMVLWSLTAVSWLKLTGFLIGMASLIFGILVATLIKSFSSKNL